MTKEEFEKWADSRNLRGTSGAPRAYAEMGWQARQPEIDALIHDNKRLYESLNGETSERCRLEDENTALKAEVERLRSEREKVVRQAKQNDKLLFENATLAGKLMQYEEPERYAEYCRILDEKNVAMKEMK